MKSLNCTKIGATIIVLLAAPNFTHAQFLNRIKNAVKETTENKVIRKAESATEHTLDQIGDEDKNKKKNKVGSMDGTQVPSDVEARSQTSLQDYKNYDFVSGDKIIYYYDMVGETDSEIPGRLLLNAGNAEIQTYQGEKVLVAPVNSGLYMMPFIADNKYLPDQFTFEFDMLSNGLSRSEGSEVRLYFRRSEEAGSGSAIAAVLITLGTVSGEEGQPHYGFEVYKENGSTAGQGYGAFPPAAIDSEVNNWRHIAIYINKNIGKLYIDQHRLGVLNQIEVHAAEMLEIEVVSNGTHPVLFKNFRIAEGGEDSYKKIIGEGKFIAYGIQFDVDKADLKPGSMGTINQFVKMMKENTALKFEIGGHTDNDGTAQRNTILSQERAEAVKKQMTTLGIDANRLSIKGYGFSQPLAENDSPENKAKNRRVEFVKQP